MSDAALPRALTEALLRAREEEFTGALRLTGPPEALLHLAAGRVTAVTTPAAPTPETLLVRSGAVPAGVWAAAYEAAAHTDGLARELLERGAVSAAVLELACATALADGVLALCLSPGPRVEASLSDAAPPLLGLEHGLDPEEVLAEAGRRLAFLADRWGPPADLARRRPVPAGPVHDSLPYAYRLLLTQANGRRTPRDLAFALGRGLTGVMADVARLTERGLLEAAAPGGADGLTRRTPEAAAPDEGPSALAKRRPGANTVRPAPPVPAVPVPGSVRERLRSLGADHGTAAPVGEEEAR
ncbi:hypothetical protein KGD83_17855 [Nocardiopsis akebiae]|uniref:MarR family transcriptional regulator n=1 Tax=Nocardiopsis akebiae TaxID=2831968 RepID=A0ABX8BYL9_9ACTN|nr:hypothetical protein [Nocardiopsis akebiae]QUX27191.1 hypothetical protein KGD83_17855 [Nocardiopsis akebiae]